MKVKDIMRRDLVSIRPEDTIQNALNLLHERQISGVPVIDKSGICIGMFTEKDVLSYILPSYIQKVGRFIYQDNPKSIQKKLSELAAFKVGQVALKEVITVKEETTLCEAARVMLTHKIRRLVVVDEAGKAVGIVARGDILLTLAQPQTSLGEGDS